MSWMLGATFNAALPTLDVYHALLGMSLAELSYSCALQPEKWLRRAALTAALLILQVYHAYWGVRGAKLGVLSTLQPITGLL